MIKALHHNLEATAQMNNETFTHINNNTEESDSTVPSCWHRLCDLLFCCTKPFLEPSTSPAQRRPPSPKNNMKKITPTLNKPIAQKPELQQRYNPAITGSLITAGSFRAADRSAFSPNSTRA